jgi:glycogen debranching enzyme
MRLGDERVRVVAALLQPALYDTVISVRAPLMAISAQDGQIRGDNAHGYYLGDHRSLSRLILTVDGVEPTMLTGEAESADTARFVGFLGGIVHAERELGGGPVYVLERGRTVGRREIREFVEIRNCDRDIRELRVSVEIACEYANVDVIKAGLPGTPGAVHEVRHDVLGWRSYNVALGQESRLTPGTTVNARPHADEVGVEPMPDGKLPTVGHFTWSVELEPDASWRVLLTITQPAPPHPFPFDRPARPASWAAAADWADLRRPIDRLLANSLADLDALRLTTAAGDNTDHADSADSAEDEFVAAGAPWYLTLFGRDSLWAARMLLPIDRRLALGTLAVLSRYQGDKHGHDNDERPGKIPHELRGGPTEHGGNLLLPPIYYGSVDATPLFITLMAESWRRDKNDEVIVGLLPALRGGLRWLREQVDRSDGGFVTYEPKPGQLSHQGWKDSPGAVTFASGRYADGPIALCEVQAYAYEAALGAAELLECIEDAHEEARSWRLWASDIRSRFREAFWIDDEHGRYPAIALDRDLVPVDGPSSNIGHLLIGDFLDDDEARLVTSLLMSRELNSGWGIRTRSAGLTGFNPYGYHSGSVWPHDTAIAILGMRDRDPHSAARLAQELLDASEGFGFRLPELFAGIDRGRARHPVPVRGACLPQAWASASAVVIAQALDALPEISQDRPGSGPAATA